MVLLTMSDKEILRLNIINDVLSKQLKQIDAALILGISPRQLQRLIKAYKSLGPEAVISGKRGKSSNRGFPEHVKDDTLFLIRRHYPDFGPTFAAEKLAAQDDVRVSVETLRQWMIQAHIWIPRREKTKRVHQPRHRRECFGELIQIDGSAHRGFEERGPQCTLLVYVDDATRQLMELRFVTSETTFDYFISTRRYLERHGRPVA